MGNYRRYQPFRRTYGPERRAWKLLGWGAVIVVIFILVKNVFGTSDSKKSASKDQSEITLANINTTADDSGIPSTATIAGRAITTKDCPKLISLAAIEQNVVALTLNAGGIPGDAQKVLEVLKQKQALAALFVTGKWADDNAETVKAYAEANFGVYNRGYASISYDTLTPDQIDADLEKAETAIADVTGKPTKPYFRPPFGAANEATVAELRRQGYCAIGWTVDALDVQNGATVDGSAARVMKSLKPGSIILMLANSDIAVDLVGSLIDQIRAKGWQLVELQDLLRQQSIATNTTNVNKNANINGTP
ncbi:MAG: polysaccharide deacetylase family protein [Candidatus Kerfeldbacteria bacterium]|nr:polysaccharide deacetylase family protein [Candidatus Kerfeldbacteria bacterium]